MRLRDKTLEICGSGLGSEGEGHWDGDLIWGGVGVWVGDWVGCKMLICDGEFAGWSVLTGLY